METNQTLDVSWETIVKIFLAGFILYILFLVRQIVIWFFFGLIISILLEPLINLLRRLKFPKILATILVYLTILVIFSLAIYLVSPLFVSEISQLIQNIPNYFEKISPILKYLGFDVAQNFQDFTSQIFSSDSSGIFKAASAFFGGISSTFFIFTLAFFISLEEKGPERFLVLFTPKKYEQFALDIFQRVQYKVAGWFGVRVLACLFVGFFSFIVFFFIGVKYSFILALLSGLLNFVPFIGPTIVSILVVLSVGISDSWLLALYVFVALLLIQEVENKFLTPFLAKKFLDLPPTLVLVSLLVGGTIFGLLGMIFIVPVFGIVYEFLKEFLEKKREEQWANELAK